MSSIEARSAQVNAVAWVSAEPRSGCPVQTETRYTRMGGSAMVSSVLWSSSPFPESSFSLTGNGKRETGNA